MTDDQLINLFQSLQSGVLEALGEVKQENQALKKDVAAYKVICKNLTELREELQGKHNKLENKYLELKEKHETLEKSVVLTRDMINREGRPKLDLSQLDIEWIKEQRASGLSLRKIAEQLNISHMTVNNILKQEERTEPTATTQGTVNQTIKKSSAFGGL